MIGLLTGIAYQNHHNPIIILVGGVGYVVFVPERTLLQITREAPVTLFIHTHVREDAIELYGFQKEEELKLFELLLNVSGIGPRTALLVTGHGVSGVEKAVRIADVDFFTTIPRLGKKNAQKIIIELKAKLGSFQDIDLSGSTENETKQIIDALQNMGFVKAEIMTTIKHLEVHDKTIEQKIRHALQILAKK